MMKTSNSEIVLKSSNGMSLYLTKEMATIKIQQQIRGYLAKGHVADRARIKLLHELREWANGSLQKLQKRRGQYFDYNAVYMQFVCYL
jgi:hypothetical protein